MRHASVLSLLVVITLVLGACGSEDSGDTGAGPAGMPPPSSNVPALVDTTGMTKAQLEAKVEEIEKLVDANTEEMRVLVAALQSGGVASAGSDNVMRVTVDGNALRTQLMTYEKALDALDE